MNNASKNEESPSRAGDSLEGGGTLRTGEPRRVVLPHTPRILALARDVLAIGCLGAIHGVAGTGKTTGLKTVAARSGTPDNEAGRAKYLRAFPGEGPTRGIRDVLEGLGVARGMVPQSAQMIHLVLVALREIQKQAIELLCIDEADGWSGLAFQGVVALYDQARNEGWPLGILLAGGGQMMGWLRSYVAGMSRTLRCEELHNLDAPHALALLHAWNPELSTLVGELAAGEKTARRMASVVMRATSGNPRRLHYFSRLLQLHFPEGPFDLPGFEKVETLLLKVS